MRIIILGTYSKSLTNEIPSAREVMLIPVTLIKFEV